MISTGISPRVFRVLGSFVWNLHGLLPENGPITRSEIETISVRRAAGVLRLGPQHEASQAVRRNRGTFGTHTRSCRRDGKCRFAFRLRICAECGCRARASCALEHKTARQLFRLFVQRSKGGKHECRQRPWTTAMRIAFRRPCM